MSKKKILCCTEASFLSTGYATYGLEVQKRLNSTGKFELAELAAFGHPSDQRQLTLPWKYYGNLPDDENKGDYQANPANKFGAYRFESVCLDFKPQIVWDFRDWWMALANKDDIIFTVDGPKPVNEVKLNEQVLTHRGHYRRVTHIFNKKYTGVVFRFKIQNFALPLDLTPSHPVLAIKRQSAYLPNFEQTKPEWINSEELKKGDIVCWPRNKLVNDTHLNKDYYRLLGYYAAEGCIMYEGLKSEGQYKGVQFTLNSNEVEYINDIKNLIKDFYDVDVSIKFKYKTAIVRAFSKQIAIDCNHYVPGLAKTKSLHSKLMQNSKESLSAFLCGLFRGDGCSNTITNRSSYCTASKHLAVQVFQICVTLGVLPSFTYNKNMCKGKTFYRYIFSFRDEAHTSFNNIYNNKLTVYQSKRIDDNYAYLTIDNIENIQVIDHDVYNFEVEEDNTYVSSFIVHNCEYPNRSAFRPYYKWAIMPTVDSWPQDEEWMDTYKHADSILTYTDWSKQVLTNQSNGRIKVSGVASPAADTNIYCMRDKRKHKDEMNIDPNVIIIGTVMRNQRRKLYPDLFASFAKFLQQIPSNVARQTFLYVHCANPDVGWNIPKLINMFGLSSKVMITYMCKNCKHVFPSFYQDTKTACQRCSGSATFPNVKEGLSTTDLSKIIGLFDLYIQDAICEGFGIPMVEAGACGVPVAAVDYSAMSDVVRKLDGYPIRVQRLYMEPETHCWRALPDNDHLVEIMIDFVKLPDGIRAKKGFETRKKVEAEYTWDKAAKSWESVFDSLGASALPWNAPARIFHPATRDLNQVPQECTHEQFVHWCFANIVGRPELANSYMASRIARDLNWEVQLIKDSYGDLSRHATYRDYWRPQAFQEMLNLVDYHNFWEQQRVSAGGKK